MTTETIPIDPDVARRERPFSVRVRDLYAWPGQELRAHFEYNDHRERWVWELEHGRLGKMIPKSTATLGYRYGQPDMQYYMSAMFLDLTGGGHEHVTSRNLGKDVVLGVFPGPLGGSFHPDSDYTEEEEYRILNRRQWRPVR